MVPISILMSLCYSTDSGFSTIVFLTGLEEAMEFLEEAFPDVEIAVAHGKVFIKSIYILSHTNNDVLSLH